MPSADPPPRREPRAREDRPPVLGPGDERDADGGAAADEGPPVALADSCFEDEGG